MVQHCWLSATKSQVPSLGLGQFTCFLCIQVLRLPRTGQKHQSVSLTWPRVRVCDWCDKVFPGGTSPSPEDGRDGLSAGEAVIKIKGWMDGFELCCILMWIPSYCTIKALWKCTKWQAPVKTGSRRMTYSEAWTFKPLPSTYTTKRVSLLHKCPSRPGHSQPPFGGNNQALFSPQNVWACRLEV